MPLRTLSLSIFKCSILIASIAAISTVTTATHAQPAAKPESATPASGNAPSGVPAAAATGSPPSTAPSGPPGAPGAAPGAPGAAPGANAPPVSITSVRAQVKDLPVFLQATGTVTPLSSVDIRSQVSSVITKVHIKEGQFVKKGEALFTLDARADEANVAKARAQLARDQASLADAQRQLARNKQLVEKNFISQGALDSVQANVDAQTALIASDKAALDAARVPLSYSKIVSPSNGRIGTITVFPGSSVQANQTPMVTITQLDPITVSFNLPQRYLSNVLGLLKQGGAIVEAKLPESKDTLRGKLSFVDTSVDGNTGTVKAKATFANTTNALWPGSFVNVSVQSESIKDAVVIPQTAIIQTVRGSIVYMIDKENKAVIRPVQIVQSQGEEAAVTGLRGGEKIAIEGRQNLRPGSTAIERPRDGGGRPGGGRPGGPPGAGGAPEKPVDPAASTDKPKAKP
jgi:RND family efflux transporter MFP subunit